MAETYDSKMGEGDNIPAIPFALTVKGVPFDLTGCTTKFKVAKRGSTSVDLRDVTPADQTTNPGEGTLTWFDAGVAEPGVYEGRIKVTDSNSDRISFDGDRLLLCLVTRDPGTPE